MGLPVRGFQPLSDTFTALDASPVTVNTTRQPSLEEIAEAAALRLYRARSRESRKAGGGTPPDVDAQFIYLWIAFSSLYGKRRRPDSLVSGQTGRPASEVTDFTRFLEAVERLSGGQVAALLRHSPIAVPAAKILDNPFLDLDCWDRWETHGIRDRQQRLATPRRSYGGQPPPGAVFRQLYTLRNQLLHGAASDGGRRNRESLQNAIPVLDAVVDALIPLVAEHQIRIAGLYPAPFPPSTGGSMPFNRPKFSA